MRKKKIFLGVSATLLITIIFIVGELQNSDMIETTITENMEIGNTPNNELINNIISENIIILNSITTENKVNVAQVESNKDVSQKETIKQDNSKSKATSNTMVEETVKIQETKNNETKEVSQEVIKEKINESSKEGMEVNVEKTEVHIEECIRNDIMIEKIKKIIQENATEDMKNFGYTIIVDSSIKNDTNQFTFTKSRVINSIRLKFGTIRIYAEDYYKNGKLIMTQCYIL